ncbi:MAG: hypothetical protein WBB25_13490 [Sulfitobacter sp.]
MKHFSTLTRRFALAGGSALLAGALGTTVEAQQVNLSGIYRAEGRNPDGTPYSGRAVIGQQGNAVQINWTVGNQSYAGSGVLSGQVLMINWGQPTPVVYVVMPSGALHGTWNDGTALERLVPQ